MATIKIALKIVFGLLAALLSAIIFFIAFYTYQHSKVTLTIFNDSNKEMNFRVFGDMWDTAGIPETARKITIVPKKEKSITVYRDNMLHGGVFACVSPTLCGYREFRCRGFGGCSSAELKGNIRYSDFFVRPNS